MRCVQVNENEVAAGLILMKSSRIADKERRQDDQNAGFCLVGAGCGGEVLVLARRVGLVVAVARGG